MVEAIFGRNPRWIGPGIVEFGDAKTGAIVNEWGSIENPRGRSGGENCKVVVNRAEFGVSELGVEGIVRRRRGEGAV